MNIIVTKHAQQRRAHHKITPKEHIISIMEYFIEYFNISALNKNSKYKVYNKHRCLIFNKDKDNITVITLRGFKDLENIKNINFKIKLEESNPKFIKVNRINFNGEVKKCGQLIHYANDWEFQVKRTILDKFVLPEYKLRTKNPEDNILLYKDKFGRFFIKDFPRKELNEITPR